MCEQKPIARDFGRGKQIEESSSRTTAHIAEGFGRFYPADFARFCVIARSSLMESQNHLIDFVHKKYITEDRRQELNQLAVTVSRAERQEQRTARTKKNKNQNDEPNVNLNPNGER